MEQELNKLLEAIPAYRHLQFKFSKDRNHDKRLIEWFADGGEIRSFRDFKPPKSNWLYGIKLYKGGLILDIGPIVENYLDFCESKNVRWRYEYISYFRSLNKNLKYCTSNLLKTVKEIQKQPGIIKYDDDTIVYSDGSYSKGNIFSGSKDTKNTIKKSEKIVNDILDSIVENVKITLI